MKRLPEVLGSLLRVALAAALFWACLADLPVMEARANFEALPDFDYWKQAEQLLNEERFSEALLVADAGLLSLPPEQRVHLATLRRRIEQERGAWMTRFQQLGTGALTGRGDTAEALTGAIVADLFVFGDVRDLVIQGGRKLKGEATDPVIVGLSAGGILLTVNPALDFGAALLKFARRVGAMSQAFAKNLVKTLNRAVARQDADEVLRVSGDMASLARSAHPAGAMAILRHVDDADELALAARVAARPEGAFALWLGGRPAITWLKAGGRQSEELLLLGARKGRAGLDFLAEHAEVLVRPHVLLGLVKGFYKGNIPALLEDALRRLSMPLLGLAGGWLAYEICLLLGALFSRRDPPPA